VALDRNPLHVATINRSHELAEHHFRFAAMLLVKNAEDDEKNQRQNQPKSNMFR
jgi:hypothetical protein